MVEAHSQMSLVRMPSCYIIKRETRFFNSFIIVINIDENVGMSHLVQLFNYKVFNPKISF